MGLRALFQAHVAGGSCGIEVSVFSLTFRWVLSQLLQATHSFSHKMEALFFKASKGGHLSHISLYSPQMWHAVCMRACVRVFVCVCVLETRQSQVVPALKGKDHTIA